ncbi:hypothetical protein [Sphingomonas paeninsulae]|uniref:hypothetical protein n=1 Tax=Sphingomonas paeninsulae TaxID=2319844 RepID=UPI0013CEC9F1|nr:hypothetical protein [Sphingomonas paeninsulae]
MANEYTDLVRFRNDGEDFHINWTTRRALRILGGRDDLVAISVEGLSEKDRYRGKRIEAGLLVADTVEYYGGEDIGSASRIVVNQLKYSTQHPDRAWPWGDIAPMLAQFAARYRATARNLAAISRQLLPIMKEESAAYFRQALEEADRVGEELHERLHMLLEMGRSVAESEHAPECGYRILRLAEVYSQINSHKFPWHDVFRTLARMHPPTALAAASRLDSRERVGLPTSLPEVGRRCWRLEGSASGR